MKISFLIVGVLVFIASCGKENNSSNNTVDCLSSEIKKINGVCKEIAIKASPYNAKDTRNIKVHYVRIPSISKEDKKEPIVILTGGPGLSGVFDFDGFIQKDIFLTKLRSNRDIILMDYRGTGFSKPFLRCDNLIVRGKMSLEEMRSCYNQSKKDNINLSDYTSVNIAYDLNEILEKEKINKALLMGFSYGTRIASTMARDYPNKVSAMILDGFFQ